jgi:hypothetical protein
LLIAGSSYTPSVGEPFLGRGGVRDKNPAAPCSTCLQLEASDSLLASQHLKFSGLCGDIAEFTPADIFCVLSSIEAASHDFTQRHGVELRRHITDEAQEENDQAQKVEGTG